MYTRSGSATSSPVSSYFWEVLSSTLDPNRLIPESRTAGSLAWPTFVAKSFSISVCRSKSRLEAIYQYVYILLSEYRHLRTYPLSSRASRSLNSASLLSSMSLLPFDSPVNYTEEKGLFTSFDTSSKSTHASILSQRRFNNFLASLKGLRKM
jgi:hypothetical protein